MEKQQEPSKLVQDMIASSEEFAKQFDPNSKTYHKGVPTKVPLGGQRIPESMKGQYPENVNVEQYINQNDIGVDYGEQYNKLSEQRQQFLNLKKELANLTKVMESIQRHKDALQAKGGKENATAYEAYQKNVKDDITALKNLLKTILPLVQVVENSEFKERYQGIRQTIESSENEFKNKEELDKQYQQIQLSSRNLFADSNKLMEQMKKIKKSHQQPNQKQEQQKQDQQKQPVSKKEEEVKSEKK